jgi:hypothetical protein
MKLSFITTTAILGLLATSAFAQPEPKKELQVRCEIIANQKWSTFQSFDLFLAEDYFMISNTTLSASKVDQLNGSIKSYKTMIAEHRTGLGKPASDLKVKSMQAYELDLEVFLEVGQTNAISFNGKARPYVREPQASELSRYSLDNYYVHGDVGISLQALYSEVADPRDQVLDLILPNELITTGKSDKNVRLVLETDQGPGTNIYRCK